jgi:mRNA-degrading endonuclease toxin of MazEF toxin-antitoxin module
MRSRGHLYWATFDKRRPGLVISIDARNAGTNDLIVIPCSTNLRESPSHVRLARGEAGALQACVLKCEQLTTLPPGEVDPIPMGPPLGAARLREVERAVARAIGLPA